MPEKVKTPLQRLKPVAGKRAQLKIAAAIWLLVGIALLIVGLEFLRPQGRWYLGVAGIGLGLIKAFFILDRVADRNADHIINRPQGRCLGGLYPWRTWALIAAMIVLGRFLRHSPLSRDLLGMIYSGIGTGLLLSSRRLLARIPGTDDDG